MEKIKDEEWEFNNKGKSLAFFAKKKQVAVSKEMTEELRKISEEKGKATVRFCLNSAPDEELQDMIILEFKENKCRIPHKHIDGNEAIHVIKGKILALIFDDNGELIEKRILSENGEFAYRNAQNRQHLYFPLSDYIIFREIRGGKFIKENLALPSWDFVKVLAEHIPKEELICHNKLCKNPCKLLKID